MKHSYYTKLTGTSFHQEEILKMEDKTPLRCIPRPDNEYDPNAVEVQALLGKEWKQIGWIAKGQNEDIHKELLAGKTVTIVCSGITGADQKTRGVNVGIEYGEGDSETDIRSLPKQICLFGDEPFVFWSEADHKAYDQKGNELYSGSKIEKAGFKEFDPTYPAKALAKKTGHKAEDIAEAWRWNGDASSRYGTLIHNALEHWCLFQEMAMDIDEAMGRTPGPHNWMPDDLADIVDAFYNHLGNHGNLIPEARIKWKKYTGICDLIEERDDGFIIHDYKIVRELKEIKYPCLGEKRMKYTLQQNCYRYILEQATGRQVLSMQLHQFNRNWHRYTIETVDDSIFEEELWRNG